MWRGAVQTPPQQNTQTPKTMNTQKVTVELARNGRFRLEGSQTIESLNPKALMLCAAAKCAALTVQAILRKGRISPKTLKISVEGVISDPEPQAASRFSSFNVIYDAQCKTPADYDAVNRAIKLTHDKYCGTIAMLRMIAPVTHHISIAGNDDSGIVDE